MFICYTLIHIQSVLSGLAVINKVRSRVHCDKYCRVCTGYERALVQCDTPSPSHHSAATIAPLRFAMPLLLLMRSAEDR
jgi:hypothetical protein